MKITSIVPWLVKAEGTFWGEFLFVEVRTDEGVNGWGEITSTTRMANRAVALILRQVNELLVGDDPANIDLIWHKIFRSFTYMGSRGATTHLISGIDIALWDIRGKVLNQPICDLLGGRLREDLLLYTHPEWRNMVDKETSIEEIRKIVDSGHTALKFDPFPHSEGSHAENVGYLDGQLSRKDERVAAELTALVRETAGPDMEILIDAHGRFNVPTAIRLCRTLEDAGDIGWFEEPVPPESYHALKQVRDKVGAAISVGERLHTRWDFVPVFEQELAEFIMPDVTWTGGITELKKIATMAEAYYVPVTPHDASGPINLVAGGHVMMTVPNFYRLETSRCDLSKYNSFLEEPLDNSGGRLKLPAGSGLGLRLNIDFMRSNIIDGFGG
ncbi:mandelate racemase/muconate lactonizing enzyme family protein [Phyllobacterium endophyticum]|uniref:Mandelate racemase n=1 Tax=Phyllobacterium endophyticum TaxID=1149773 RepID=A0A2P7AQZ6_9HYPH|nr:mandelate racemase/muconate lactonizing enzyme family protein [Phyllobacterium endophyticum]MBB3237284.1 galactonate dehydratase [Phyllobacterium endophyticum]PSH56651.1 mandelate racemase [Phyllobacterium endophyticum]TYR44355.1 mandelate racemase/muconate lactonizing enzyme family protein [Phyllobacterium endophyticum]